MPGGWSGKVDLTIELDPNELVGSVVAIADGYIEAQKKIQAEGLG